MLRWIISALLLALTATPLFASDKPDDAKKDETKSSANPTANMRTPEAINYYIAEGWKKADIKKPAGKATDLEFLRRVFIDVLGRVATLEEALDYEADQRPNKRQLLVKRLIYGQAKMRDGKPDLDKEGNPTHGPYFPKVNGTNVKVDGKDLSFDYASEFADHWADVWSVWLMSRTTHPKYREQLQSWLWDKFYTNAPYDKMVRELITANGVSNRNGAVNFIVTNLGDKVAPDRVKELGHFDSVPITSRVTRLFLGLQTQCTQCHDHPFNKEWIQSDFWGVNAFFRQTSRSVDPTPRNAAAMQQMMQLQDKIELSDDASVNADTIVLYERRDGTQASSDPRFLKDYFAAVEKGEKRSKKKLPPLGTTGGPKTRREALADYLVQHDQFAKAYASRMWGHFFGRGFNKTGAVDDFGSENEIVHPELLERLAEDFTKYGYNTKELMESICTSDVYNLSHVANKDYADTKYDAFFARMPLKAMSPETLFESLSLTTKAEAATGDKVKRATARDNWMNKLVRNFGDDEGNELTFNGTVIQALLMMNGKEINDEVTRKNGVVEAIVRKHSKSGQVNVNGVIDDLFLTALNRHATQAEIKALKDIQDGAIAAARDEKSAESKPATGTGTGSTSVKPAKPGKPTGTIIVGTTKDDPKFYQDVFWALLNTTEFMLNH